MFVFLFLFLTAVSRFLFPQDVEDLASEQEVGKKAAEELREELAAEKAAVASAQAELSKATAEFREQARQREEEYEEETNMYDEQLGRRSEQLQVSIQHLLEFRPLQFIYLSYELRR